MKRLLIFMILLLKYFICIDGQERPSKTKDQLLFDLATNYYYDENYDSAIYIFSQIVDSFPQSAIKGRAQYNIGYIYFETKKYEQSIPVFHDIIRQNYNEFEPNGLMEQYTLYKHRSCEHLAEIFIIEKNYQEALKYTKLFDKKYPYKHFCGNELAAYDIYRARCYARVFEGYRLYNKAFKKLLPLIFDNGLADNDSLLIDIKRIAEEAYSKDVLRSEIEKSYKGLKIKSSKNSEYAIIVIFGKRVKVYDFSLYALGNLEYEKNIELEGYDKYRKVLLTNDFLKEYLK